MSDLKPCPFCGDDAEWVDIHDDEYGNTGGSVIECVSCGASTHVEFGFKENLTSAWNRRAASRELVPAMAARIEELEAKLAKAAEALDKLARLGNGEKPGNSDGNMIARAALAEINGGGDK